MPISHILLAVAVAAIWGFNFIAVKFALIDFNPLFLCAFRFFLASIPAVFFIKRPAAPFKWIILYGLIVFGLQFSFVFLGIKVGMPAGLASILMQTQVFFSLFFAMLFLAEFPKIWQIVGAIVSFSGIGLVGLHLDQSTTLAGFLCILAAASSWGIGNLITKRIGRVNMMSLVVWGSFTAFFPLLITSFAIEGSASIVHSLTHFTWKSMSSVCFIAYISTWMGYGIWNWLISRHPVTVVVPFSLLIPVFGMLCAVIILHEPYQVWKLISGILVVSGLCINLLGPRLLTLMKLLPKKMSYKTD